MNNNKQYTSITDLLTDDGFLAWHLKKNVLHEQFWDKWIAQSAEHAELAQQAERVLIVLVSLEKVPISGYQRNASFDQLLKKIRNNEKKMANLI